MINLLPQTRKDDITYGRKNSRLLKYCSLVLVIIFGMACITFVGSLYIKSTQDTVAAQVESSKQSIKSRQLESVQKQAEQISNDIKLTTDVLSKEILFSKLLKQIGAAMPANTSLTDLKIDTAEKALNLSAIASSYDTASQVQVNLSDPKNAIFEKADIIGINCNVQDPRYPCEVTIKALFGDNSSYLFINPAKEKKQ